MRPIVVVTNGVQDSNAAPLDTYCFTPVSVQVAVTGTATYTVQQTLDNVLAVPPETVTWFDCPDATFVGATANKQGKYDMMPAAIRIRQTAGTGSTRMTIIQSGNPW